GATFELVLVERLSPAQIVQYAGVSGDYNPAHTDNVYAVDVVGYPSVFAHGMLTMGMSSRVVSDYLGADAVRRFGGRFTAQVWPGDALVARMTVTATEPSPEGQRVEVEISTRNQHDVEVFRGYATALMARRER